MHQLNLYSFLCCSQAACFSHPFVKSRKSARQNEITASNIKILLIQTRRQIHIQYDNHILKMKILESEFRYMIYHISGGSRLELKRYTWHQVGTGLYSKSVELKSPAEPKTLPSITETTRSTLRSWEKVSA